jgi:sugar-specific transcriptional regulator TrmB
MSGTHGLTVNTTELADTAKRLDELADRLDALLKTEAPHLSPAPVGRDEVSVRAATTLTEVQGHYVTATAEGITELREIAAALRAGAGNIASVDQEFAL